jgi:hypothetical protein
MNVFQLQDVLRIGIEKLLHDTNEMDYAKIDFASILGRTNTHGHWLDIESQQTEQNRNEMHSLTAETEQNTGDMYMFEGVDYRSDAKKADVDLFDRLIHDDDDDENRQMTTSKSSEVRSSERPARRKMTMEEKTARAEKIRETKARRQQEMVSDDNDYIELY